MSGAVVNSLPMINSSDHVSKIWDQVEVYTISSAWGGGSAREAGSSTTHGVSAAPGQGNFAPMRRPRRRSQSK